MFTLKKVERRANEDAHNLSRCGRNSIWRRLAKIKNKNKWKRDNCFPLGGLGGWLPSSPSQLFPWNGFNCGYEQRQSERHLVICSGPLRWWWRWSVNIYSISWCCQRRLWSCSFWCNSVCSLIMENRWRCQDRLELYCVVTGDEADWIRCEAIGYEFVFAAPVMSLCVCICLLGMRWAQVVSDTRVSELISHFEFSTFMCIHIISPQWVCLAGKAVVFVFAHFPQFEPKCIRSNLSCLAYYANITINISQNRYLLMGAIP